MSDKKNLKKNLDICFTDKKAKTVQIIYKTNKSDKNKSHSLNKLQMSINKEQILKEFYLYKLNSTNATNKISKNKKLNKSFTKSSQSKQSGEKILLQVRSMKSVKKNEDNSYKTNANIRNIYSLDHFNYNELCRSKFLINYSTEIYENKQINRKKSEEKRINTKDRNKIGLREMKNLKKKNPNKFEKIGN